MKHPEKTRHENLYYCILCRDYKPYESSEVLKEHAKEEHAKDEKHEAKCFKCKQTFPNMYLLTIHMEEQHADLEYLFKFRCEKCSFKTIVKDRFEDHMTRNVHEQDFNTNSQNGDKSKEKVTCNYCNFSCFDKSFLEAHNFKYHNDSDHQSTENGCEKCQFCPKSFDLPKDLTNHLESMHLKEKDFFHYSCTLCSYKVSCKLTIINFFIFNFYIFLDQ